ncbi:MAG: hypothetical protein KatS3mg105_0315 [Gemmatales bacterium]|nr:MAG: hypothetical protein KatS3mg105_0315 [Gemmatales bacterium]
MLLVWPQFLCSQTSGRWDYALFCTLFACSASRPAITAIFHIARFKRVVPFNSFWRVLAVVRCKKARSGGRGITGIIIGIPTSKTIRIPPCAASGGRILAGFFPPTSTNVPDDRAVRDLRVVSRVEGGSTASTGYLESFLLAPAGCGSAGPGLCGGFFVSTVLLYHATFCVNVDLPHLWATTLYHWRYQPQQFARGATYSRRGLA